MGGVSRSHAVPAAKTFTTEVCAATAPTAAYAMSPNGGRCRSPKSGLGCGRACPEGEGRLAGTSSTAEG